MNGKSMGMVSFWACAFLIPFYACNPLDRPATEEKEKIEGTGQARIHLPAVSKAYRPDSSTDTAGRFLFQLEIQGSDMPPMHTSWLLDPGEAQPVALPGIPAGAHRVFTGRLLWLDAARGDSTLTHEGADTADIIVGGTADILLYLHRASRTGSARVCVIVEGLPPDTACGGSVPPDTLVPPVDTARGIDGCWKIGFRGMQGSLHAWQRGKNVGGTMLWADGTSDSLSGVLEYPYLRVASEGAHGTRRFRGNVLKAMDHFEIKLLDTPMGSIEKMIGDRGDCDSTNTGMGNGRDTVVTCWRVNQTLANGNGGQGVLYLARTESAVSGWFRWDRGGDMAVSNGSAPAIASPLYLFGDFPPGLAADSGAMEKIAYRAHYKAKLSAAGDSLEFGSVYRHAGAGDFTNGDYFGSWGGKKGACQELLNVRVIRTELPRVYPVAAPLPD